MICTYHTYETYIRILPARSIKRGDNIMAKFTMNIYLLFCLGIIHPVYTLLTNSPNGHISLGGRRIQSQKAAQQQQHPSTSIFTLPPNLESLVTDTLDADRKIIVVTGGVLSGIGKGVTASSIGVVSMKLLRILNALVHHHVHSVH